MEQFPWLQAVNENHVIYTIEFREVFVCLSPTMILEGNWIRNQTIRR